MYAIPISLFHEVLGKNPGRISKRLIDIVNVFNWHEIDLPTKYDDYITFERLNRGVVNIVNMKSILVLNTYLNAILIKNIKYYC